jgi:hypothetical protein
MGRAPESPLERGQARRLPGPAPSHGQRPHECGLSGRARLHAQRRQVLFDRGLGKPLPLRFRQPQYFDMP